MKNHTITMRDEAGKHHQFVYRSNSHIIAATAAAQEHPDMLVVKAGQDSIFQDDEPKKPTR